MKHFVRYLLKIFCKYCCALFQETFFVIFTHDISTFHVCYIFAIGFNNSTHFTILYVYFTAPVCRWRPPTVTMEWL